MNYKQFVKDTIKRFGMNETEFAALLGYKDKSTVTKWKSGKQEPSPQALLLMQFTERQLREAADKLKRGGGFGFKSFSRDCKWCIGGDTCLVTDKLCTVDTCGMWRG